MFNLLKNCPLAVPWRAHGFQDVVLVSPSRHRYGLFSFCRSGTGEGPDSQRFRAVLLPLAAFRHKPAVVAVLSLSRARLRFSRFIQSPSRPGFFTSIREHPPCSTDSPPTRCAPLRAPRFMISPVAWLMPPVSPSFTESRCLASCGRANRFRPCACGSPPESPCTSSTASLPPPCACGSLQVSA